MNVKNIYTIVKKEIKSYLTNPATYIISAVFVVVWEFLFFQNVFLVGEASLQGLFSILIWFLLLLVPAVTMGSVAEEVSKDTLESVLTHPISDWEFILGKVKSSVIFVSVLLLFSFPIALSLNAFGDLDFGVFLSQYIAALLLTMLFVSIGVATSSFFKSQVPALMLSVIIIFIFIIIGFDLITISLPSFFGNIFSRLSVLTHYNSVSRGVIDLRDIWYFFVLSFLFMRVGYLNLISRRFGKGMKIVTGERFVVLVLAVLFVATSGLGFVPVARLDLTDGNIYTLTDVTKNILSDLNDDIVITLYASDNLPAQYQPILTTVKDVLHDYSTYGNAKLKVEYKNPGNDDDVAKEAQKSGVVPVQFNVVGDGELQVKQSYFGVVVKKGDDTKTIPVIQDTSDLEYKLTSFINELTNTDKKKIAFVTSGTQTFSKLSSELSKQFTVEKFIPTEATSTVSDDVSVVVVAGPTSMFDETKARLVHDAISKGKNLLLMVDGVNVNANYMSAIANGTSSTDVLGEYGITVNQDLVYDLRSNQTIQVGGGMIRYFIPYPFFVQAVVDNSLMVGSNIVNVTIPWGSSVFVNDEILSEKGFESIPLVYTTKFAGIQSKVFNIDPKQKFDSSDLGQKTLAVLLKSKDSEEDGGKMTRIVVIGDSDFVSDGIGSEENIAFGMDVVSYLAQENSLASIKIKQTMPRPLVFENAKQIMFVRYGNLVGSLLVIVSVGVFVITRRKKLSKLTYKDGKKR